MKKLLLTTAIAALSFTAVQAQAADERIDTHHQKAQPEHTKWHAKKPETKTKTRVEEVVSVDEKENETIKTTTEIKYIEKTSIKDPTDFSHALGYDKAPKTFKLKDRDGAIQVSRSSIYVVTKNGNKYYAPDGQYTIGEGITFFAKDGGILRVEGPADVMVVNPEALM